jgi:hypothetical protein
MLLLLIFFRKKWASTALNFRLSAKDAEKFFAERRLTISPAALIHDGVRDGDRFLGGHR